MHYVRSLVREIAFEEDRVSTSSHPVLSPIDRSSRRLTAMAMKKKSKPKKPKKKKPA